MPIDINFSQINSSSRKLSTIIPNKKNTRSFHISNIINMQQINQKEKILFNQGQLCPKCNEITYFDPSDIFGLSINTVKVNFEYECKKCGFSALPLSFI